MGARFHKRSGIEGIIGRSAQVEKELKEQAERAAAAARAIAPVESGAYRNSIKVESGVDGGTVKARINAHDFKAGWIEFGTSKWPAHATLRRACESVGLRLTGGRG